MTLLHPDCMILCRWVCWTRVHLNMFLAEVKHLTANGAHPVMSDAYRFVAFLFASVWFWTDFLRTEPASILIALLCFHEPGVIYLMPSPIKLSLTTRIILIPSNQICLPHMLKQSRSTMPRFPTFKPLHLFDEGQFFFQPYASFLLWFFRQVFGGLNGAKIYGVLFSAFALASISGTFLTKVELPRCSSSPRWHVRTGVVLSLCGALFFSPFLFYFATTGQL